MLFEGSLEAPVLFVSDFQRINCRAEGKVLSDSLRQYLDSAIKAAGLLSSQVSFCCLYPATPSDGKSLEKIPKDDRLAYFQDFKKFLATHKANVIVPLGEECLNAITSLDSISKWHCSVVSTTAELGKRKCLPLYHPSHVEKLYSDHFYLRLGCQKLKKEMLSPDIHIPHRVFHINPKLEFALHWLSDVYYKGIELSVDIETGRGQINTVGFASSPSEAIAIKTLAEDYTPQEYLTLWKAIARVLEGPQPKNYQNFINEATWFARYGIALKNTVWDTMWAQKFLHPELEKGLDNVGRIYTDFPYWKDDNDDWNNVRDWHRHLEYNCKDTTGTYAARIAQSEALKARGLHQLFSGYVMRFAPCIQEMCIRGLRVNPESLIKLQTKIEGERDNFLQILNSECMSRLGYSVNPRSPKQVKDALKKLGMKLPTKKGEESSDKKALVKLAKKYPNELVLKALIGLSAKNKQLSSYIDFDYDRRTNKVHYTIDGCGTETGRWSAYKSPWGEGFNPQTVPKSIRGCFLADPGKVLIQIDLSQAETRFVAWDAPEPRLMQMLTEKRDVHKYVASKIFNKPEEFIGKGKERDLGKKSGHAANYDVGPDTFAEACLVEMDMPMERREAQRILGIYNQEFPGIYKRKLNIQKELRQKRMLKTPIGRERYFYGRMDDNTFREAYAYAPQSTIPDITNHLMLKLWEFKEELEVEFLLQVHDSLLLQAPPERVDEIAALANDLQAWHPKIKLPGGELWISVEVEVGERWYPMTKI